jgi:hypothetical protein
VLPARTIPAVFAGADTGRASSTVPTPQMITAPRETPSGTEEPSNMEAKPSTPRATHRATRKPTSMATPPR